MPARRLLVFALTSAVAAVSLSERADAQEPTQHVTVAIHGTVAHVSVKRTFVAGQHQVHARARTAIFDVALPADALDVSFQLRPLVSSTGVPSPRQRKTSAMSAPMWLPVATASAPPPSEAVKAAADPEARHRVFIEGVRETESWQLQYSFIAPLNCDAGMWVLDMPGAVDLSPVPSTVDVTIHPVPSVRVQRLVVSGQEIEMKRRWTARAEAPAQSAWQVRVGLHGARAEQAIALVTRLRRGGQTSTWAGLCRRVVDAWPATPEAVTLVVDVSRSVGPGGLSLQREYARGFLSALPSGTLWNAVLFGRHARTLFPVFRLATGEAIAALDDALVPGALQNGTQPGEALKLAAAGLREHAAGAGRPLRDSWLVLVTDGSIAEGMRFGDDADGPWARSAAVLIRAEGEQPPDAFGRAAYRRLLAARPGVLREPAAAGLAAQARSDVADVGAGGDWLVWPPTKPSRPLALPPGRGGVWRTDALPGAFRIARSGATREIRPQLVALRLPPTQPLGPTVNWQTPPGVTGGVLSLPPVPVEATPAGELDRAVLKNALALAYMPRARACYLNRTAATGAARDLSGRVRVVLQIERGEVLSAAVASSSLAHAAVETCLVEAAYQVVVPRPVGRDAPVEAILNLVFQPATTAQGDHDRALDRDIEILLAPLERTSVEADLRLLEETRSP